MDGEQPFMERHMRALHDGSSAASEFAAAFVAEEHTGLRLTGHAADLVGTAMGASHEAAGPARGFDMLAGGVFVMKAGFGKVGHCSLQ